MSIPSWALSLVPVGDSVDRCVDTETGDFYIWNYETELWEKEEQEQELAPELEQDIEDDALSALQVQVNELEDDVSVLSDEVSVLSSYDAPTDYNLGTSNQGIFSGLVSKVPFGQHYVYWRDGQYSYKFAYGDLSLDGSVFTGSGAVTICNYSYTGSSYNNYYTYTVSTDNSFSLSAGNQLVYSDLGNYPGLQEREVQTYVAITAYTAFGVMLFLMLDRLRRACFC